MIKQSYTNYALYWNNIIVSLLLLAITFISSPSIYKSGKGETYWLISGLAFVQVLIFKITQYYFGKQTKKTFKDLPRTIAVLFASIGIYHTAAVIFGAPFLDNFEGTAKFALLLTTLTTLPNCLYLGPETTVNMFLSLTNSYDENVAQMVVLRVTILGAWAGAMVIPLDWGRYWQEWPISCCIGTVVGFIAGSSLSQFYQTILNKSKRILL